MLIGGCIRQRAIADRFGVSIDNTDIRPGHRVMWKIGRAVEDHVRTSFIRSRERSGIFGNWVCRCGETAHLGFFHDATRCRKCGHRLTYYREPVLTDREFRVKGSPDLTFTQNYYFVPVETKSMNKEQFDGLTEPLADHVNQVALYRWLYERNGMPVHTHAIVHYTVKDFRWASPYKEFLVDCTADRVQSMIGLSLQRAAAIRDARNLGRMPERTACSSSSCSQAKKCAVVHLCFDGATDG